MTARARQPRIHFARPAFTLIELLTVIGIIALLVGIVLVAGSGALASSKRTQTERFLNSVISGLEQFKSDHGYYPPLLNPPDDTPGDPVIVSEAVANAYAAGQELEEKRYYSVHTLSAYLIGVGDLNDDGREVYNTDAANAVNVNLDDGADGPGFRSPGPDQSWGGARSRVASFPAQPNETIPEQKGRTYGPYIDIAQNKNIRIAREDQNIREETADPQHAKAGMAFLVDRWNKPIRYYRYWPTKSRSGPNAGRDSLREIPIELLSPSVARGFGNASGGSEPGIEADTALMHAPFALLSAGEDGFFGESLNENAGHLPQRPDALFAREFSGITEASDREKMLKRMSDNVRATP